MDDFDRTLLRVSLVLSLASIALVTVWMVLAYRATDSACDLFGGQVTGTASVSWFPPGKTCTYEGGAYVDSPSYLRVVVLLIAVAGLPFTWWMSRSLRPRRRNG